MRTFGLPASFVTRQSSFVRCITAQVKSCLCLSLLVGLTAARFPCAAGGPSTEEDLRYQAAIAQFAARMKELNYPALFDQAAAEFNVPPDILKGVAFAETRWDQLTWAPDETASPENGMPRPYGIMSLWDNPYFGHSLLEAAGLIGQSPDVLKQDAYQNMRGGAALLRKLYDENPKPEGTTEADLESWRYAIRKYCGIPEPELNAQHALDVYTFIDQGYHQYGIEWEGRPVNLAPIRAETRRIMAEEQAKRLARLAASSNLLSAPNPLPGLAPAKGTNPPAALVATTNPPTANHPHVLWAIVGVLALIVLSLLIYRSRRRAKRRG